MEASLYPHNIALLGSCWCGLPGILAAQPLCSQLEHKRSVLVSKTDQYWEEAGEWPGKQKGDCFASHCVHIPVNVLWMWISIQILLPLCHQRSVRARGRRGYRGHALDFFSLLPRQASLGMVFPTSFKIIPHCTLCLDLFLGTFWG